MPIAVWKFLHLLFAFSYAGSIVVAEWNTRFARRTPNWNERAALFAVLKGTTRFVAIPNLVLLGLAGNVLAAQSGRDMARDSWLHVSNGIWLLTLLVLLFVSRPAAQRLEAAARAAGNAGDWEKTLGRWRLGNVLQSVLLLATLGVMVFRWNA
jgi:hypothetical protein